MSRNDGASRSAAAAQQTTRSSRLTHTEPADPRAAVEFSEILSHRERVRDGSASDGGAEDIDGQVAREPVATPAPSLFTQGGPAQAVRPQAVSEQPLPVPAGTRDGHGANATQGTVATPATDHSAPLMPEAILEAMVRTRAQAPATTGAGSWIVQIATSASDSAELHIERMADGSWQVRVRGDEERSGAGLQDDVDARSDGIVRDPGEFATELERLLVNHRPDLRADARGH